MNGSTRWSHQDDVVSMQIHLHCLIILIDNGKTIIVGWNEKKIKENWEKSWRNFTEEILHKKSLMNLWKVEKKHLQSLWLFDKGKIDEEIVEWEKLFNFLQTNFILAKLHNKVYWLFKSKTQINFKKLLNIFSKKISTILSLQLSRKVFSLFASPPNESSSIIHFKSTIKLHNLSFLFPLSWHLNWFSFLHFF